MTFFKVFNINVNIHVFIDVVFASQQQKKGQNKDYFFQKILFNKQVYKKFK